jgi:iron(III) transport system permease protein
MPTRARDAALRTAPTALVARGKKLDRPRPAFPALPSLLLGIPLGWLVLVPLAILVVSAFKPTGLAIDPGFTLDNLRNTYGDGRFWRLVGRTAEFSASASLGALVLGTALAWLVERTDLPGRGLIRVLAIMPMAMPPFLLAIAWIMLLSPRTGLVNRLAQDGLGLARPPFDIFTMGGMIFVEMLALVPSVYLVLAPAWRNIDPSLEESALVSGAGLVRLFRRILLPLLMPALAGTAAYLLIVSFVVFDVPGTIGMPARIFVLSTEIYTLANNSPTGLPDYGAISAMALLLVVGLTGLGFANRRFLQRGRRFATVTGKSFRPRPFRLGRLRRPLLALTLVYFLGTVGLPLGALVWTSFMPFQAPISTAALANATLANHRAFFTDPAVLTAAGHSLEIALVAASAVTALSLLVSWVVVRSRAPGRGAIDLIAFLPVAMPGVLIATALILVYLSLPVLPIYGTVWIIAVAYVTLYLSFGSRTTNGAMAQLSGELEEAARVSGAGWGRTLRRILVPLLTPALGSVWLWVFAHCLRELSSALLLQGVDNATVPTILFNYWSEGSPSKAAAVGLWLVAGLLAVLAGWAGVQRLAQRARTRDGRP